jgi:hypothetical protein
MVVRLFAIEGPGMAIRRAPLWKRLVLPVPYNRYKNECSWKEENF